MRVNKGEAFVYGLISILAIAVGTLAFGAEEEDIAKASLTAVVAITASFITGSVADNGVKGKFFNENLANKEK